MIKNISSRTLTPFLEVSQISKKFGSVQAVSNISFDVQKGEIVSLIGPSGCGKSTILRIIAGFETLDSGNIFLNGKSLSQTLPEKRDIGMVFQDYALFPHLTVLENIKFAMRKIPVRERKERAKHYLTMVGLTGFEERYPSQLSGGQQQRVALARSFSAQPGLILLDEPFSNLDAALRRQTRREIRSLLKATGISIIFVTHDQEEALSFSDRICVLQNGKLEQAGTPTNVYDCPVNSFVADFLGRTNIVSAFVRGGQATSPIGTHSVDHKEEGSVLLSIRPEHLKLEPLCHDFCSAKVIDKEFRGNSTTYWVQSGQDILQVDMEGSCPFSKGDKVSLKPVKKAIVIEK